MREEYYVPTIEDLRVGYECEVRTNYGFESFNDGKSIWLPITIGFKIDDVYTNQLSDIIFGIDDGYQPVRTLYLTREQIELEGWKVVFFEYKDAPYEVDWIVAEKGKYKLYINLALTKIMHLHIEEKKQRALYRGKCPSINEFRTIQKLVLTP